MCQARPGSKEERTAVLLILGRREFPAFLPALPAPLRAGLGAEAGAIFAPCLASRGQTQRQGGRGRGVPSRGPRSGAGAAVPSGRRWPTAAPLQSASARPGDGAGSRPAEGTSDRPQRSEEPSTGLAGARRAPAAELGTWGSRFPRAVTAISVFSCSHGEVSSAGRMHFSCLTVKLSSATV